MFTKTLLFVFAFVGIFSILFAGIESSFYANQNYYSASIGEAEVLAERFSSANVTMYGQLGSDNMSYSYSSYHDHPSAPQFQAGLPSGQYLQVWWGLERSRSVIHRALEFRHVTENWWGLAYATMEIYGKDGQTLINFYNGFYDRIVENTIDYNILSDNWDSSANVSIFYTKTPIAISVLLDYNQTAYSSLTQAWEGGELGYTLSYEYDVNATQMSIWGVLATLLTFSAPSIGITGIAGLVLSAIIAIPVYIIVGIGIAKIIFAIIPFIRGIEE